MKKKTLITAAVLFVAACFSAVFGRKCYACNHDLGGSVICPNCGARN